MTHNAGDLMLEADYVKLEVSGDGGVDGGAQCPVETSPCCSGADGKWWYLLWWWAKLGLVGLFVGALLAVFLKWIGPFVMEKEIIPLINWERKSFSTMQLGLLIFGSLSIFPSILLPSSPSMWIAGMTFGYGYGFLLVLGGVTFGVSLPFFIGSLLYHNIQVWLERYPKRASVIRLAGEGTLFNQFRAVAFIRVSPFPYIIYNYCAVATAVKFGPYLLGTLVGMVPEIFLTLYTSFMHLASAKYEEKLIMLSDPPMVLYPVSYDAELSELDSSYIRHASYFVMYVFPPMIGTVLILRYHEKITIELEKLIMLSDPPMVLYPVSYDAELSELDSSYIRHVSYFVVYVFPPMIGTVLIFRGIIIQTLADASDDQQSMSGPQILFNIAGFCITAAATVLVTLYAKRRLKELQMEEVLVLQ